ncbi:Polyribonucleotide nucleotidyltransferase [Candidatus Lokiarchaeum ossiferum]|uniref:Polyribonucleotide nucleotidyltransferase n=1 Tax=Candidatus Lokiarchaeum ossiferum TaxID=2951803 RepID=A0ABY6I036_9ARCH|nr:Polyribonucleotide nucleotidyltransferase [Candidatus Lokiarchaeum sp. B-35]
MGETSTQSIAIPQEIDTAKIQKQIAANLSISLQSIQKSIELLLDGNTVPFIARYRKEATGALDEIKLRSIQKEYNLSVGIEERKISVLNLINKQNKLTLPLRDKILEASTPQEVEDLYLPFKIKHKTLGAKAREKGLEPLAILIKEGVSTGTIDSICLPFMNKEKGITSSKEALSGAVDIVAEEIGNHPEYRQFTREIVFKRAIVKTEVDELVLKNEKKINSASGKAIDPRTFEDYFDFSLEAIQLQNHQILAINRAEDLEVLDVSFETPEAEIVHELKKQILHNHSPETHVLYDYYIKAIEAGFKRYIIRAIKRELWKSLCNTAEAHAITVFATNLKNLLMTPPIKEKAIIGLDPGYRTGCKVAVIDQNGNYLADSVIYPHPPKNQLAEAKKIVLNLAKKYHAYTFAVGNGTASRETEQMMADLISEHRSKNLPLEFAIVSEAGASIYSASEVAIEEFPDLDLTVRGAISIARRLQDPLAELIKIDPKSIGVGMYQHDVNQAELKTELDAVIEDCVNGVGVDLNTASSKLLEHVSGLNKRVSKEIVKYRSENGNFYSRNQLYEIKGLGPKAFEQCAGFLKIMEATNPLDRTFVHPESYELTEKILAELEIPIDFLTDPQKIELVQEKLLSIRPKSFAKKMDVDPNRIRYLAEQLRKPNLDPREKLDPVILRQDVLSIEDLKEGMILKGTVRNVLDFGAFVDIGVKYNGLVHKSQIANQFVKSPYDFLAVGDVKDFMIIGIDLSRNRIQLSIKQVLSKKSKGS